MQITVQQIDKFIQIYQKNFGVVLSRDSAYEKGNKLAETIKLILQENYEKHRKTV